MLIRKNKYALAGVAALLTAALAVGAAQWNTSGAVTLPAQTPIHVRLDQTVSSNQNRPGDRFQASLAEPIVANGKTVAPQGARVEGLVVDARPSGRLKGVAVLRLALESIEVNGKRYAIRTTSLARVGGGHKKRNLEIIGGGAGGGAILGAIAAGGKGALIGGPVGAGAGTVAALLTGRKNIRLPAEMRLTFALAAPVRIEAKG